MAIKQDIRTSRGNGATREVKLTPIKAIRYQCMECTGWSPNTIKECGDKLCSLYPFQMGKRPSRKGKRKMDRDRGALCSEIPSRSGFMALF